MPPGSGVPVPGANAGSSTSTSTGRKAGTAPTRLPGELPLPRPVAAEADLDVALRGDVAGLDEAVHGRSVRDLDAEDLRSRIRVRVEVNEPERTMPAGAGRDIGLGDRVVAAEHERERARVHDLSHRLLDRLVRPGSLGREDGRVAEVDDPQLGERV